MIQFKIELADKILWFNKCFRNLLKVLILKSRILKK